MAFDKSNPAWQADTHYIMEEAKRERLEAKGFIVTSVQEMFDLTDEEMAEIDAKIEREDSVMKKAPGDNLHAYFLHLLYRLRITRQCKAESEECIIFENSWWKFKSNLKLQFSHSRRPFKGMWAYEWQIGPAVIQWLHDTTHDFHCGIHIWRLRIWYDARWWR